VAGENTEVLSIDSGTNGAEILGIIINGLVGTPWTVDIYIPSVDAVDSSSLDDKRSSITYEYLGEEGGALMPFIIPYNCFIEFSNDYETENEIEEVTILYRSAGELTVAWLEA
jgi:hypothetical protein